MESQNTDRLHARVQTSAGLQFAASLADVLSAGGVYDAVMTGPLEKERAAYLKVLDKVTKTEEAVRQSVLKRSAKVEADALFVRLTLLRSELAQFETEEKWRDTYHNLVTDVGANYLLDNGLAGSGFTAAYYMGLISDTSWTGVAVGNTMASHAGWTEDTNYSQANRITTAWSAAAARAKALSAPATFTMNATTNIRGSFLSTNNTKGGTTGTLYSAGAFTGGVQPAASGNTLTVSYSGSV